MNIYEYFNLLFPAKQGTLFENQYKNGISKIDV